MYYTSQYACDALLALERILNDVQDAQVTAAHVHVRFEAATRLLWQLPWPLHTHVYAGPCPCGRAGARPVIAIAIEVLRGSHASHAGDASSALNHEQVMLSSAVLHHEALSLPLEGKGLEGMGAALTTCARNRTDALQPHHVA